MLNSTLVQSPILHHTHLPALTTYMPFNLYQNLKTHFTSNSLSFPNSIFFNKPHLNRHSSLVVTAKSPRTDSSEQKWSHEGSVVESLPNGMFRVRLDNDDIILGYISGKIRKNFVRILPGDRVKIEVSRYDSTKGRIIYRLRSSA